MTCAAPLYSDAGMPLVSACVPDGLSPGDPFIIEAFHTAYEVLVPTGCVAGQEIEVEVPDGEEAPSTFDVTVPEGLVAGEEMLVEAAGQQFNVAVPDGCGPGSVISVSLPSAADDEQSWAPEPPCAAPPEDAAPLPGRPPPTLHEELSDSDSDLDPGGRHAVGHPVEVLRSDGSWSLGTVEDFEGLGCTYTVRLPDGRCKYLVEEGDLRLPRCLLRLAVTLELVFFSGGGRDAKARLFRTDEGAAEAHECGVLLERSARAERCVAGTRWAVRGASSGAVLLEVVAASAPAVQRHVIVAPPDEAPPPAASALLPGLCARLGGMVNRADLNGAEGVLLWWVAAAERWAVQILAPRAPGARYERLLVRERNLVEVLGSWEP